MIHDVGHGSCISLVHENGNVMLWDCGHTNQNRPSSFLPNSRITTINRFFVTNYDQDHISDLVALRDNLTIQLLHRNTSISAESLRILKRQSGPITTAMSSLIQMIGQYSGGPPAIPPSFPGVEFESYWNSFGTQFADTNNLSQVTYLDCRGLKILITGDIERAGWRALLQRSNFVARLREVQVFVASHHGRESGYCAEVFNYCSPSVVVCSDSNIVHSTQEMASAYRRHASGVQFNGTLRHVLTTRNDGPIWWDV